MENNIIRDAFVGERRGGEAGPERSTGEREPRGRGESMV